VQLLIRYEPAHAVAGPTHWRSCRRWNVRVH